MKPEELRINNLVQDPNGNIGCVARIEKCSIEVLHEEGYLIVREPFTYLEPIPLTEQWLLDFEFEKVDEEDFVNCWKKDESDIACFFDNTMSIFHRIYLRDDCVACTTSELDEVDIKHVHQLQNLYFALTGKELTKKQ